MVIHEEGKREKKNGGITCYVYEREWQEHEKTMASSGHIKNKDYSSWKYVHMIKVGGEITEMEWTTEKKMQWNNLSKSSNPIYRLLK